MELSCLDGIIGVSETDCECLTTGLGSDELSEVQTSASGVFLDQLEGFNLDVVKGADDCAKGGLWDRALNAIRQAQKDFVAAMFQCIGATYTQRIKPIATTIGEAVYTGSHNYASGGYAGIRISTLHVKGAVLIVKKIGVIVNSSVPVTVKIFSNEHESTLVYQSSPINATANTLTWAVPTETLELPLWSYNRQLKYYVVFELDGTYQPKDTRKDCGCGGVQRPYLAWMDFEGATGIDTSNMASFSGSQSTNGIMLDIEIKCKASETICSDERPLDFEVNPEAMDIAYAIRYRAAARLYSELLASTNISRQTMLDRETLAKQANAWNQKFTEWVNYLCGNVEMEQNGCWTCKNNATTLIKTHIKSTGDQWMPLV